MRCARDQEVQLLLLGSIHLRAGGQEAECQGAKGEKR